MVVDEDQQQLLQLAIVLILGFWTVVYMVWECIEDVINDVWSSAERVVYREVYRTYVEPRVLRRLQVWQWRPVAGGRRLRHVFVELLGLLWLDASERAEYEQLCVDALVMHHRFVPRCYIRRCVAQLLPAYLFQQETVARLWTFLTTTYNAG